MQIKVEIDDKAMQAQLEASARQWAKDVADALNLAAQGVQADIRRDIRRRMKVRNEAFTMRQVKLMERASAGRGISAATLGIDPKPRSILSALEQDGDRPNLTRGEKEMAVPVVGTLARPQQGSKARLLSTLALQEKEGGVWAGQRRVFLIPGAGIFQRRGKGTRRKRNADGTQQGDAIRLIWSLQAKVKLRKRLHFFEVAQQEFGPHFFRALEVVRRGRE